MIKKFIAFIIVGAICFIGGYLLAVFNQKHHIFSATNARSALAIAQDPTQAVGLLPNGDPKSAPTSAQSGSAPSPGASSAPAATDKSSSAGSSSPSDKKEGDKKTEEAKTGAPNDQQLLASLWMVKKNKASELSNMGLLYMDGTSPYGLPQVFKEDLFAQENMLTVPEDPDALEPQMIPSAGDSKWAGQNSGKFWLQLGAFPSIVKAQKIASYFLSKGYEVDLYQGPYSAKAPPLYFVRLRETGSQDQLLKKARVMRELEHLVPTLVPHNIVDKKL